MLCLVVVVQYRVAGFVIRMINEWIIAGGSTSSSYFIRICSNHSLEGIRSYGMTGGSGGWWYWRCLGNEFPRHPFLQSFLAKRLALRMNADRWLQLGRATVF